MRVIGAALVLAAVGGAAACDIATLSQQSAALEQTCCQGQKCTGGLPKTCSKTCAPVFNKFWDDCGAYLKYLPTFSTDFTDFSQKCQHKTVKPKPTDDCSPGKLLTTMFFDCADIDQNDASQFCNTACSKGIRTFVERCAKRQTAATKDTFDEANKWLAACVAPEKEMNCYDADCGGESLAQCATASSKKTCEAMDPKLNCDWKRCEDMDDHHTGGNHPPPPPVHKVIPGCMDEKAVNYNPEATVQADGACIYSTVKPQSNKQCTARRPYACHTQQACEGVGMQWLSCHFMETQMNSNGACQRVLGQCSRPCSASSYSNCHTKADCEKQGTDKVQWYVAPPRYHKPGTPAPPPPVGRCERACSKTYMYTCRTQAKCEAVGMQWKAPSRPIGSTGKFYDTGSCQRQCSKGNYRYCYSEAACKKVGMQWTVSQCCGSTCPPTGIGRCERPCSIKYPYSCRSQIACEGIGRQWVPSTRAQSPTCHGPAGGSCSLPCTQEKYYYCKVKAECEAVGMEWHPATKTTVPGFNGRPPHTYTRSARCAYPCSILRSDECDTKSECEGIGFNWVDRDGDGPMKPRCEKVCSASNYGNCLNQADCEATGNQWIMENVRRCPPGAIDCGIIIDPGFGGGFPPPPPGSSDMVGRCIAACTPSQIYNCKTAADCGLNMGVWHAFPSHNGKPSTGGTCQAGCSATRSYQCHDKTSCEKQAGGQWKKRNVPKGRPASYYCDVSTAGCDLHTLMGMCAASTSGGHASYQLCNSQCGRYLTRKYDTCVKTPPSGMTSSQFTTMFAPIVTMCKTVNSDSNMRRCASESDEAVMTMQRICCTDDQNCAANGGIPTKCTGDCADAFLPYFEKCGSLMLTQKNDPTSLSKFYQTCTTSHVGQFQSDPKLCSSNKGNSPWVAIDFRTRCSVFIKYVDARTKKVSDFVRLVSVYDDKNAAISIQQFLSTAKRVCGKRTMVKRVAEDFSGLLALSGISDKNTIKLEINDPAKGNVDVTVTNTGANRDQVAKQWTKGYDVNKFNPDRC